MKIEINILHTIVATLIGFVAAFIYYLPPVFGNKWGKLVKSYAHLTDENIKPKPVTPIFWLLTTLINAVIFQIIFNASGIDSLEDSIKLALLLWIGLGVTFSSWPVIFAKQPAGIWLLNNGAFLLMQLSFAIVFELWK